VQIAIDGIGSASNPHHFLSVTKFGYSAIVETEGNNDCHVILRGGSDGPNYAASHVQAAADKLAKAGVNHKVMVDFSHANSSKQHKKQIDVANDVAAQVAAGTSALFGVMIESHLVEGNQKVVAGQPLTYGQSITDACLGWEDTTQVLATLSEAVSAKRNA